jgi:ribosomal protein S14
MGEFTEVFTLPSRFSMQDVHDCIEHWTKTITVGTKFSVEWIGGTATLLAYYPSTPSERERGFGVMAANLVPESVKSHLNPVCVDIVLRFRPTRNEVLVEAVISGPMLERSPWDNRAMRDYRSLKAHLLSGSGVPDRDFDRYLTEQFTKRVDVIPHIEGAREAASVEAETEPTKSSNRCPHCGEEIRTEGLVRPDGSAVCPRCFRSFIPISE